MSKIILTILAFFVFVIAQENERGDKRGRNSLAYKLWKQLDSRRDDIADEKTKLEIRSNVIPFQGNTSAQINSAKVNSNVPWFSTESSLRTKDKSFDTRNIKNNFWNIVSGSWDNNGSVEQSIAKISEFKQTAFPVQKNVNQNEEDIRKMKKENSDRETSKEIIKSTQKNVPYNINAQTFPRVIDYGNVQKNLIKGKDPKIQNLSYNKKTTAKSVENFQSLQLKQNGSQDYKNDNKHEEHIKEFNNPLVFFNMTSKVRKLKTNQPFQQSTVKLKPHTLNKNYEVSKDQIEEIVKSEEVSIPKFPLNIKSKTKWGYVDQPDQLINKELNPISTHDVVTHNEEEEIQKQIANFFHRKLKKVKKMPKAKKVKRVSSLQQIKMSKPNSMHKGDEEDDIEEETIKLKNGFPNPSYDANDKKVQSPRPVRAPLPWPVHKALHFPVIVKVPEPYTIHVPVPVAVEKTVHVPVEKIVKYPVVKPVPVKVVKKISVPVPVPYPVPVNVNSDQDINRYENDGSYLFEES